MREHQVMSIREPTRKAHRGYFNYIWNEKPVAKEEYQFVYKEDDFVILGHQEDRWLGWTEVLVSYLPHFVLKVCFPSSLRQASDRFFDNLIGTTSARLGVVVQNVVVSKQSLDHKSDRA